MIYCLIGKSATGKSTIEKELENNGLIRIISSTTRPPREGEKEGVDYYYIGEEEFNRNIDKYYEHTQYRDWLYCIDPVKNNIDLSKDYVCVIEPHGYRQLIERIGQDNVVGIYIIVEDKERLIRALNREEKPDCKEICRRYISDIELFLNIENEVQHIVENEDLQKAVLKILNLINKEPKYFNIGDKIRITKIASDGARHLKSFVGQIGYVYSKIIKGNIPRYKIIFNPNTDEEVTAYFRINELELIRLVD